MKTVRDACVVQDNALSIKLSEQIEQLDEPISLERDGTAFFEKIHSKAEWIVECLDNSHSISLVRRYFHESY